MCLRLSSTVREAMGKLRSMESKAARLMTSTLVTVSERMASSCVVNVSTQSMHHLAKGTTCLCCFGEKRDLSKELPLLHKPCSLWSLWSL